MAKFLDTTGISYHLQQIINQANDMIILISPYLKINERLRQALVDKGRLKLNIRLIYGKKELLPEQKSWLREMKFIRIGFCQNLHAKCYMNEKEAIVTSMNMYEFSQVNNHEMGILITRDDDPDLYQEIYKEARRLIRISDEVRLTIDKIPRKEEDEPGNKPIRPKSTPPKVENIIFGFCIRCKTVIPSNLSSPHCPNCTKVWMQYNRDYPEKYCHLCGKEHQTTSAKPVCLDCFQKNRRLYA